MFNDPHLRSRVDLHQDPIHWIPADDFADIFRFVDARKRRPGGGGGGGGDGGGDGGNDGGGDENSCEGGGEPQALTVDEVWNLEKDWYVGDGDDDSDGGGVREVLDLLDHEGNLPWDYDSGKPLYKYVGRSLQ